MIGTLRRAGRVLDAIKRERACRSWTVDDVYFTAPDLDDPVPIVLAVEQALVRLRGRQAARGLIGNLFEISSRRCTPEDVRCLNIRATISRNGRRLDPWVYHLALDEVRLGNAGIVSIAAERLTESHMIWH